MDTSNEHRDDRIEINETVTNLINKEMVSQPKKDVVHSVANIIYWASFLLLLIGARELISPGTRKTGEVNHIYITLISFEVYMWLLVGLNCWHHKKNLFVDSIRSMLFTLSLSGFFFMALNELYNVNSQYAIIVSIVSFITCVLRMKIMSSTVGLVLPKFQYVNLLGWLLFLVLPAPLFKIMSAETRYMNSLIYCWAITLFLTTHLFSIKKQKNLGFTYNTEKPLENWFVSWVPVGLFFALAVTQCMSVIYVFADYSYWYFSPIFLTMSILCIAVNHVSQIAKGVGWVLFTAAVFFMAVAAEQSKLSISFPAAASPDADSIVTAYYNWGLGYLLNPYIPPIIYASFVFALCGIVLSIWWMILIAAAAPTAFIGFKGTKYVVKCKNGKGITMLLAAFVLLAAGIAIQWSQDKWGRKKPSSDEFETSTESTN